MVHFLQGSTVSNIINSPKKTLLNINSTPQTNLTICQRKTFVALISLADCQDQGESLLSH